MLFLNKEKTFRDTVLISTWGCVLCEGGGSLLNSALTLSCVFTFCFTIFLMIFNDYIIYHWTYPYPFYTSVTEYFLCV